MQAQTRRVQRFGFNRIAMLALAIGALVSAATAFVLSDVVDLPFTSESQAVTASPFDPSAGYQRMRFLEQNVWESAPAPAAYQELDTPQLAGHDHKFLEENIWDEAPANVTNANRGDHRASSFEMDGVVYLDEQGREVGPYISGASPTWNHRFYDLNAAGAQDPGRREMTQDFGGDRSRLH